MPKRKDVGKMQIFLSTDMKNTVSVEFPNDLDAETRNKIIAVQKDLFKKILERWGTKQKTEAEANNKNNNRREGKSGGGSSWRTCKTHNRKYDSSKYKSCFFCSHPEEWQAEMEKREAERIVHEEYPE